MAKNISKEKQKEEYVLKVKNLQQNFHYYNTQSS